MTKNVGVWIDHKKAVIVSIIDGVEEIHSIVSEMEKHVRHSGGEAEDQQEHRFSNHLREYYAKVISFIHNADAILILGPGEAKGEFEKRLRAESFGERVIGVETEDKMTDHQIVATIRDHFVSSTLETQNTERHKNHSA
jgi:stalled ribosome rescue protein Dom34